MKLPITLAASWLALAFSCRAQTGGSRDDLTKLDAAIVREIALDKEKSPVPGSNPRESVGSTILGQIHSTIAQGGDARLEALLSEASIYLKSDALRQQCDQVAAQMRAERQANQQGKNRQAEAALKDAARAVRSAKKPADLDASVLQLGELAGTRSEEFTYVPSDPGPAKNVQVALEFVKGWQSYLAAVEAGDSPSGYAETLNRLSNLAWDGAIPRSEILARERGLPKPPLPAQVPAIATEEPAPEAESTPATEDILKRIKTPSDVAAALEDLEKIRRDQKNGQSTELTATIQTLAKLDQVYQEFQAGLSTRVDIAVPQENVYDPFRNLTASIRAQILTLVLPRYLDLPVGERANPGEGPHPFLDRIATEAMNRGDYLLAARARETQRLLREGSRYGGLENTQVGMFIVARNQETAGQFALAVQSYEKALAYAGEILPPKLIGDRLTAISAAHPQEFQRGVDLYLSPPLPNYGGMQRAFQSQLGGRPPTPTPAPSLTVPAASSKAISAAQQP